MDAPLNDSVSGDGTREYAFTPISGGDHLLTVTGVVSDVEWEVFNDPGLGDLIRDCDVEYLPVDEGCYIAGLIAGQTYYLQIIDWGGGGTSYNVQVFAASPPSDGFQPNDSHPAREIFLNGGTYDLALDITSDKDWFEGCLGPAMSIIQVTTMSRGSGFGNIDTVVEIWDLVGVVMHKSNDDQPNSLWSQTSFTGGPGGWYSVRVRSFGAADYGDYRLVIAES